MFDLNDRQKEYIKGGTLGLAVRGSSVGWAAWNGEWLLKGSFDESNLSHFLASLRENSPSQVVYLSPTHKDAPVVTKLALACADMNLPIRARKMSAVYDTFMPPPPAQFGAPTAAGRIKEQCDITGIGCADEITAVAVALVVTDRRLSK